MPFPQSYAAARVRHCGGMMKGWLYFAGCLLAAYIGIYGWSSPDKPEPRRQGNNGEALLAAMPDSAAKDATLNYVTIGRALKCGVSQDRLARLMVTLEAIIKATAIVPSLAIETGHELLKLGIAKQGEADAGPCSQVILAIEKLEAMRARL